MHEYEQALKFGATGDTFINPIVLVFVCVSITLVLTLPRRHILLPLLVTCFFVPLGQVIMIGGLHFYVLRFLILAGWTRVVASGWWADYKPCRIDKVIVLWAIADTVAFVLLWGQWDALINRTAFMFDLLGSYFLFRLLYRGPEDIDRAVKSFAVICFVLSLCMVNEKITGRNLFWVLGGVPEFTAIRVGSLRAQGPFAHPILAGTFGAILLPLFTGLWWRLKKARWLPTLGIASAVVVVIASASSTPLLTATAGLIGLALWPFRRNMRVFRWGIVLLLTGLHLVMKAPVWALISRIDIVGGSSADHRYELVNKFILHFSDWCLVGVKYTGDWGYLMHDVSNQFVGAGTEGGLAGLVLFIAIIVCCFQALGIARKSSSSDRASKIRLWSLGATLFAYIVAFFGISLFDQTSVAWYSLLAMITVSTQLPATSRQVVPILQPAIAMGEAGGEDLDFYHSAPALGRNGHFAG